jgi:hypothetical protein
MTFYYLPDLTGQNPAYLEVDVPCGIYAFGIKIPFDGSAIFEDSLVFTYTDGTGRVLTKGVDWTVETDDIDMSAMNRAHVEDMSFSKRLIKSVTIPATSTAVGQIVAATYQKFNVPNPGVDLDDGTPLELTPDVIRSMQSTLALLSQKVANVTGTVSVPSASPNVLPFDLNGTRAGNVITNEPAAINTVAGVRLIRPEYGDFFANSVSVTFNGQPLAYPTDYDFAVVSPLTKQTTNTSGIYKYIRVLATVSGTVNVTYHAVGGEVQPTDVTALVSQLADIRAFLNTNTFVTESALGATGLMQAIMARTVALEDDVRRLMSGPPTYGDANTTSGSATTRPILASDSDLHWYTIASLYKVSGSDDVVRADQFKGRVYLPDLNIALGFTLDFNMNQTRNPVSLLTESLVFDPGYVLFGDQSVNAPQWPMLRVVWNTVAGSFSGAFLQFGIPLPTLSTRMVVESTSSAESCWLLVKDNEILPGGSVSSYTSPSDDGFVLPNQSSVWSSSSGSSKSEMLTPKFDDGYLVYAGSTTTIGQLTSATPVSYPVFLPPYFDIDNISSIVVTFTSNDSSTIYDVELPMTSLAAGSLSGRGTFCDSDLEAMVLMGHLTKTTGDIISMKMNISEIANPLISGTPSSKLDVVRYIRAKV